jgi:K+/H+ antiporter YhaU regulatory subunit KhtT
MERTIRYEQQGIPDINLELPGMELVSVQIKQGSSYIDSSISSVENSFGGKLSVLAIRRIADVITHPESEMKIQLGDRLIVFASRQIIELLNRQ